MPQEPRPRQISGNRLTPASCSDDVGAGNQQLTPHVHTGVFHYPHVSRVCSNQSRGSLRSQATHFQSCHNEAAQTTLPCGRTAWTRSRALANQRQASRVRLYGGFGSGHLLFWAGHHFMPRVLHECLPAGSSIGVTHKAPQPPTAFLRDEPGEAPKARTWSIRPRQ